MGQINLISPYGFKLNNVAAGLNQFFGTNALGGMEWTDKANINYLEGTNINIDTGTRYISTINNPTFSTSTTTPIINVSGKINVGASPTFGTAGQILKVNSAATALEYSNETIYTDIKYAIPEYEENVLSIPKQKRTINLVPLLEDFTDSSLAIDPHHDTAPAGGIEEFYGDIRNYVTFVRDDFKDPVKLINDDNTVFRILCGTAFKLKLLDIYKQSRRSYFDILNGVPVYTEDLFYRIAKSRKKNEDGAEWEEIQDILIPNTDL